MYKYYKLYRCYWNKINSYNKKPTTLNNGLGQAWWMRSIPYNYGGNNYFCGVLNTGQFYYVNLNQSLGVAPGFCI